MPSGEHTGVSYFVNPNAQQSNGKDDTRSLVLVFLPP